MNHPHIPLRILSTVKHCYQVRHPGLNRAHSAPGSLAVLNQALSCTLLHSPDPIHIDEPPRPSPPSEQTMSTRSPSRNSVKHQSSAVHAHAPGVLAVTASMIAKANNHPAAPATSSTKGTRARQSKGTTHKGNTKNSSNSNSNSNSANASVTASKSHSTANSGDEESSSTPATLGRTESEAGVTIESNPLQNQQAAASTPSKAPTMTTTLATSSKRRQRQQKSNTSEGGIPASDDILAPSQPSAIVGNVSTPSPLNPARDDLSAPTTKSKRVRAKKSSNKADDSLLATEQGDAPSSQHQRSGRGSDSFDRIAPSPPLLSKSAPTPSFMQQASNNRAGVNGSALTAASKASRRNDNGSSSNSNIRGSNSADEWDMPSVARGTDALTWQQQSLGRKGSLRSSTNKQPQQQHGLYAKQAINHKATASTAPSGISAALAASSLDSSKSAESTPAATGPPKALTWQQELFQRSAPTTPSELFAPLEEGFSGAHPAKESAYKRGGNHSPSKPRRTRNTTQRTDETVSTSEGEADLGNTMNALDLNGGTTRSNSRDTRKAAKKASESKRVTLHKSSVPHQQVAGASHQRNMTTASEESDEAPLEELNPQAQLARLFARASPMAVPSPPPSAHPVPAANERPLSMSASPSKAALYAGPKFHNSPSAGQLPTPRLAALLDRNREPSPSINEAVAV